MTDSASDSYSYSYSDSSQSAPDAQGMNAAMWVQISRIPIDVLDKTDNFVYINKVLSLVSRYDFTTDDPHMSSPESTTKIGRLLKVIASQCGKHIAYLSKGSEGQSKKWDEEECLLRKKIELQNDALAKLRRIESHSAAATGPAGGKDGGPSPDPSADGAASPHDGEVRRLRVENDLISAELRKLTRTNEELTLSLQSRRQEQSQVNGDSDKLYLEYKHLVARHRRLIEKSQKTEEMLTELRNREKTKRHSSDSELDKLRDKVRQLQQENLTLIDSRDHAEELCEKREAEALRDMNELRRLTKDLLEEERSKVRQVRDEYLTLKQEADAHVEELLHQHDDDLRSKDEEVILLQRQLEKLTTKQLRRFNDDDDETAPTDSLGDSYSGSEAGSSTSARDQRKSASKRAKDKSAGEAASSGLQRRLERENDELVAEVEELEIRIDAIEDENRRLTRLVKDYESGDEGLSHLRHELGDALRTVEVLQDENAQLRERLNGMEDSLSFTAALQELCKRMGVTADEINSLKPQNAAAYSEMDNVKEELNVLKEEVEWLEKERRHWMNKVRLQPLMDTKLRFELGLTSEQLRQLDNLVDQMKTGNLIVEDDDGSYKEKYFKELEARRKDAAQFNDYVKRRIEEALLSAFGVAASGDGADSDAVSALAALKDHIDVITSARGNSADAVHSPSELTRAQLQEQAVSMRRQLEQQQLTARDNTEVLAQLREKLAAAAAEADMVGKERDQYREAIFAAAGAHYAADDPEEGTEHDALITAAEGEDIDSTGDNVGADGPPRGGRGPGPTIPRTRLLGMQSKWATISGALREQLGAKDALITALTERISQLEGDLDGKKADSARHVDAIKAEQRTQDELRDQVAAMHEINEDLVAKNRGLQNINTDVENGMQGLDSGSKTRELLQKVILLRRREVKLMSRLRRAIGAQEEAAQSERKMRVTMDHTLTSLREAFEGTSTGFVLPPSSSSHNFEEEQLNHLHLSVVRLLSGKLFREDSRYLLHLQHVYHTMESRQEMAALRLRERDHLKRIDGLQGEVDRLTIAMAEQQQQQKQHGTQSGGASLSTPATASTSTPAYSAAVPSKWESESVMWRQKYELCYKRLESKDAEVALLEAELDTTRQEIVDVKDHVRNILSGEDGAGESAGDPAAAAGVPVTVTGKLARYEREVARLKSINLGLLQHTLDLQGSVRSIEIDVEARRQELALLRDSGTNGELINDFVSAAIREHAALRRQSELAMIQTRRMKIQLAATEANYQVVANEATAYKLSAYRLYRRYVDEMVAVVDYVRCIQRASKGALSPHRAEIIDRRFQRLADELADALGRSKAMAADLADRGSAVLTLEQQLKLVRLERGSPERQDAIEARLREARAAARGAAREMAELKEDGRHADGKVQRLEAYVRNLTEEITRLEFGAFAAMSPLDDELLRSLTHLKDTVFAKAAAPPLAISAAAAAGGSGRTDGYSAPYRSGYTGGPDDSDTAVREYKAAVMRQRELAGQCEALRRDLGAKTTESERLAAVIADQADMAQRLEEKAAFYQQQLDAERGKAEAREGRLRRAHETQAEVSRRAMDHNAQCLREMVQKKEGEIVQLREQLNTERRRYMEQQLEEASRMERVHEGMFRENNAMVERFKVAIDGVGDSMMAVKPPLPGTTDTHGGSSSSAVLEQLRYLTAETIRLQNELGTARSTNIVLESQLTQHVSDAQRNFFGAPLPSSQLQPELSAGGFPQAAFPAAPAPAPTSTGAGNVDGLTGIIKSQSAMLESLRQREAALGAALQAERQNHAEAQKALEVLRMQHIEKDGALNLVSQVGRAGSDPVQVHELRAQLAAAEQELRSAREQLEQERGAARQLQAEAAAWKAHLDGLHLQVASQQSEAERSRHLTALNEGLHGDLNALKGQNDKLVLASSLLKQRLLDEARRGGDSARQHQHEIALAQRMGSLQQESSEQMKALDRRIREIQRELTARIASEKDVLARNEDAQRIIYGLHQQLRAKDREIAAARGGHAQTGPRDGSGSQTASPPPARRDEKGTQMLSTVPPQEQAGARAVTAHSMPHPESPAVHGDPSLNPSPSAAAAAVGREVHRLQRDNLQQLSLLRSTVGRLEKDLAETRDQLKGEREASRLLRGQLHGAKKAVEEAEAAHARELADAHRGRAAAQGELNVQRRSNSGAATGLGPGSPPPPAPVAYGTEADLRRRLAQLAPMTALCDRFQQEVAELRAAGRGVPSDAPSTAAAVPAESLAGPLDIRNHVRTVTDLEGVIDDLRRQLQVTLPARASEQQALVVRLLGDLAALRGVPVEELRGQYVATPSQQPQLPSGRTVAELESALLAKGNALLELRFAAETLELRAGRLQRHLDDVMAVDAAHARAWAQRSHQGRVESLEAVVENLQLVVHALQREKADLVTQAAGAARLPEMAREVVRLRERERDLQAQLSAFAGRLAAGPHGSARSGRTAAAVTPDSARLQDRLVAAQASADAYHAELEQLRATLEGQMRDREAPAAPATAPAPAAVLSDRRAVRPLEEDRLPRLDSRARPAAEGGVPPPLPSAPFGPAVGATVEPHARMRHHNVPRR